MLFAIGRGQDDNQPYIGVIGKRHGFGAANQ
jgi:hypothetical protein